MYSLIIGNYKMLKINIYGSDRYKYSTYAAKDNLNIVYRGILTDNHLTASGIYNYKNYDY